MPSRTLVIVQLCVNCSLSLIGLLVTCYILKTECQNRRKQTNDQRNGAGTNIHERLLDIWFLLTLVCTILGCLFWSFAYIPADIACKSAAAIGNMFFSAYHVFITLFAIARLQYCFMDKQVHSRHGYSKWIFYILYCFGFCVLALWAAIWIQREHEYNASTYFCDAKPSQIQEVQLWIVIACYSFWDALVLFLYILKTCQIQEKMSKTQTENNQRVMQRVTVILNKIILLTVLAGMLSFFLMMIEAYVPNLSLTAVEAGCKAYIMYLMIERNNEHYMTLMRWWQARCVCCDCTCLIGIDKEYKVGTDGNGPTVQRQRTAVTMDTGDATLKMEHSDYEHGSVATVDAAKC